MIELFEQTILNLESYLWLLAFLGGFVSEEFIIFLSILSGAEGYDIFIVAIFGFFGILIHDSILFLIGKSKPTYYLKRKLQITASHRNIELILEKIGGKKYFPALFISKFIYGTRIIMILYLSHVEKNFSRFFLINLFALILWTIIMIPLGWLAGAGTFKLIYIVEGFGKIVGIALVGLILLYIAGKLFSFYVIKKDQKHDVLPLKNRCLERHS